MIDSLRHNPQLGIRNLLTISLFVIYIIGAHLRLSIYSGSNILVPMYIMLASAALLALINLRSLARRIGFVFLILAFFVLLQPLLSSAPGSTSMGSLRGGLQLMISMSSALAVIYAISVSDPRRVRRVLLALWSALILLALIESIALKPVFDQVRDAMYEGSGRFVYLAEARDLAIYGRVRTTVFASEPSFLADTLSALLLMVFFLDPCRGSQTSWMRLGAMVLISFFLAPSFKMAFYLLALGVWHFWPENLIRFVTMLFCTLFISIVLSFAFTVTDFSNQFLGGHASTGSFFGRLTVAPTFAWEVLKSYPLFGFGIGNDEGTFPLIASIWNETGAFVRFPWFFGLPATDLMSNGFWWQWVFLGLLGGVIFAAFTLLLLMAIRVEKPFRTLFCAWIVWYGGAAFVDPQSWYAIVVFSVGSILRTHNPTSKSTLSRHQFVLNSVQETA